MINGSISHGYVRKKGTQGQAQLTGKRILCSNRYGRSGCGRTRQLYLADIIPRRQYRLSVVVAFVLALLSGGSVEHAYQQATGAITQDTRHAWRWLNVFYRSLAHWRIVASLTAECETTMPQRHSQKLTMVLSTLNAISGCLRNFQLQFQCAFLM